MTILLYVNIQKKNIFCEDFDTLTHGVRSPPPPPPTSLVQGVVLFLIHSNTIM